ncbi:hypothetical protein F5Y11DRAFT_86999 [Daldinia sp. FL1419]|nr:hypothetical protein F5Y11DRAFT_86999 [Daldinia sp. FL1419]
MTPSSNFDDDLQIIKITSKTDHPRLEGDENSPNSVSACTAKPSAAASKRKLNDVEERQILSEIDNNNYCQSEIDETCDEVREKITNFIQEGNMKVGEFQRTIGVSSNAYQRFMNQSGAYSGKGCDTYRKAFAFFKRREIQGLEIAPPKKLKKSEVQALDVGHIKLDGEDTQSVPVYDTCDEVRKKIRAFLRNPNITQAAFCRTIAKSFPEEKQIQSRQLSSFLEKKGPMSGNTSSVFYGAYVFFEKLRIKEGKPKSKIRQEMEKIHPSGVNTTDLELWWTCRYNERPVYDRYGRVHFV